MNSKMVAARSPELHGAQPLPRGRLLYRQPDEPALHALYRGEEDSRLWLSRAEFPQPDVAAGPFDLRDAVRAWRLSNVLVPDGCELVAWQTGIVLFRVRPLPAALHVWRRVDLAALEPSLSRYGGGDISGESGECSGAPTYPPRVAWVNGDAALTPAARSALEAIRVGHAELQQARVGMLKREWNAHPVGSLVLLPGAVLESGFFVVDFVDAV